MRPPFWITLIPDFPAGNETDTLGELHFEIGILRACQQFSGYAAVHKSNIFHIAAPGMADNQERAVRILPVDVFEKHALDGAHLSVSIALCFRENDFQVFVFNIRLDSDIFEADIPYVGSAVTDNAESGVSAGAAGAASAEDIAILHEDVFYRSAVQLESERDAVGMVPTDQQAAAYGDVTARRIIKALQDLGLDGDTIITGPDETVLNQEVPARDGIDAVKPPDSRVGKNLDVTENRVF